MTGALDRLNAFLPYPQGVLPSRRDGALSGQRLAVKDVFDVAGYPTGAGNAMVLAASGIKLTTAPLVQVLLDAGAEFAGKTYTDELAYSLIGSNRHFGRPINPRWPDRIAGGSSSGSAVAVAAGLAEIGLGTDTSGSIRLPAAANALYGWRPTHGMLTLAGCRPLAPSLDTAGFLTRSKHELADLMNVLGVPEVAAGEPEFLIAEDLLALCDGEIVERFRHALADSGHRCRVVPRLLAIGLDEVGAAFSTILWREAYLSNEQPLMEARHSIDPAIDSRLDQGRRIGTAELAQAHAIRQEVSAGFVLALGETTVLALPTIATPPPGIDAEEPELDRFRARSIAILCLAGLGGCPQVVVPCFDEQGAYVSVSLIAPPGADRLAMQAAERTRSVMPVVRSDSG